MEKAKMEIRREKIGRTIFYFLFSLFAVAPLGATTVSGTIKKPDGTPINGAVEFTLSQPAKTTTPPVTYALVKTTCTVLSGAISAGCTVQGNDTLDPAGTFYRVRVLDLNNLVVVPSANYTISGAAVDLGSLPVTATDTLVPPTGSVTGNLNVTGNLTVGGSVTFAGDPENFSHIRLLGLTADPATATTGSIYHRSDLNRIRFRTGGLEIFDGTQYLPVNASSTGTIEFGANLSLPGLFSATFKRMNQIRLVDPFLWLESGVNAKINAAITDCGGFECRVLLPSNLTSGDPTRSSWPETAGILDLRNLRDPYSTPASDGLGAYTAPFRFQARKTTDTASTLDLFSTLRVHLLHDAGGDNISGGPKDQYAAVSASLVSAGRGEDHGVHALTTKYGEGDAAGILATSKQFGNCLEGGGECSVGGRFAASQGTFAMTATISSATDDGTTWALAYSSPTNEFVRGVGRYVINTTVAKVYTVGSVTSISGVPPVVTGSGTSWATQFGSGTHTDLCFSQNDDDAAGFKFVVPIRSIASNTSLTLDYAPQGADAGWPGDVNGSNYRIYYCGKITAFNVDGGSLSVQEGATNWATADTIEVPLGWAWYGAGVRANVANNNLPGVSVYGLAITQTGDEAPRNALITSGKFYWGLEFANTWECWANNSNCALGGTMGIRFNFMPGTGIRFPKTSGSPLLAARDNADANTRNLITFNTSDQLALGDTGVPIRVVRGIANDGGGFKHSRVSTGSISASSSAAVTISWTTAFADASYTVNCSVVEATAGTNSLRIHHLESVSASSVIVRVVNDDGATAKTGTLHCSAIHD